MNEEFSRELIREIEREKGRLTAHERECIQRYSNIEGDLDTQGALLEGIAADLAKLRAQGEHAAWSANWKAWGVAALIGSLLLSALAWTAAQLYVLEPGRVTAAQHADAPKKP